MSSIDSVEEIVPAEQTSSITQGFRIFKSLKGATPHFQMLTNTNHFLQGGKVPLVTDNAAQVVED